MALLAKVGWKTMNGENRLWGDTLRNKYLNYTDLLDYNIRGGDSYNWKGIIRSMRAVEPYIKWRLGDGKSISLWHDIWLGKYPISKDLDCDIVEEEKEWKVADILDVNGNWDKSRMQTIIPEVIWTAILATPRPFRKDLRDKMIWGGTTDGQFSCKSAYRAISEEDNMEPINGQSWEWLWKLKCSERIRYFLWLCTHKSIVTNSLLFQRKIAASNLCQRCNNHEETITHVLRDCTWTKEIWNFVISPTQFLEFMQISPDTWIKENVTKVRFGNIILPNIPWNILFVAIIWSVWKSRNQFIFQGKREPVQQIIFSAKQLAEDLLRIQTKKKELKQRTLTQVKWTKPNRGWHKVNTDGSVFLEKKSASAGGLIRDDNGEWITGFTRRLGGLSITVAELLAAREGLSLAWERRLPRIVLELDSEVVVELIKEADTENHPLGQIIDDCRALLRRPWESRIVHTLREGNHCADVLAKLGHDIQNEFMIWGEPPTAVLPMLYNDLE